MKILNFGSMNIDYTYKVEHIVTPGETISSNGIEVFPGGKGLNQSVALAKAKAEVYHAGMIGKDGLFLKEVCEKSGVHTNYIKCIEERTGNAMIQVSEEGQNSIILFAGATRKNTKEYIKEVLKHFEKGDFLLLQNEINLISELIDEGKERGMTIVLNPSPFDRELLYAKMEKVDYFLINEVEGKQITGELQSDHILKEMQKRYPKAGVVLTLGEKGAIYQDQTQTVIQNAVKTNVVDTTAAGDTFTGYFLAAVMEKRMKQEALKEAAYAAALAVSRKGASVSIPEKEEVIRLISEKEGKGSIRL